MDEKKPTAADVSRNAERKQARNEPDPFPPEGTDEKVVRPDIGDRPLSEPERVKATEAVIGHKS